MVLIGTGYILAVEQLGARHASHLANHPVRIGVVEEVASFAHEDFHLCAALAGASKLSLCFGSWSVLALHPNIPVSRPHQAHQAHQAGEITVLFKISSYV